MILHIVNQSPFHNNALQRCIDLMTESDSLLLIEDAVLLLSNPDYMAELPEKARCFGLLNDIESRGLVLEPNSFLQPIDYEGFVDLVVQHDKTMSWF